MTVFFQLPVQAMPTRLIIAIDGIAYRDLAALQAGVMHTNFWGKKTLRHAFTAKEGYYPVSRMISTFPSTSDVAWTDIFGDRPLPGYQRTYFSKAADRQISINSITTSMEHERQMDYQLQSGFFRALGYIFPVHTYRLEVFNALKAFRNCPDGQRNFYVYLRATDDSQHLDRDIGAILCDLDRKLQKLRASYKAKTGHDLEILLVSDHGHNHAGRGRRVEVNSFLEKLGYHVSTSINGPKDVVLPTAGIESWVEIHNAPIATEQLTEQLCHLPGADVIAAKVPGQTNRFLVMNSKSERAFIDWRPKKHALRYDAERGDPLDYLPVVAALKREHKLDANGFASADDWMHATMTNHYPVALERIARGLTCNTLNPATILVSLNKHYVHDAWLVQTGSRLVTCGSTHGALDNSCSDGIVLSNFQRTHDTTSARVAAQFNNFAGLADFRKEENGAEWFTKKEETEVRIKRRQLDHDLAELPNKKIFLCVWSPLLTRLNGDAPLRTVIQKSVMYRTPRICRYDDPPEPKKTTLVFPKPLLSLTNRDCERIYSLSSNLVLDAETEYQISGWIPGQKQSAPLFTFNFRTGPDGRPLVF